MVPRGALCCRRSARCAAPSCPAPAPPPTHPPPPPSQVTWSNGNVFRSLTLLAATWCEQQGMAAFDGAAALTAPNLADFMGMLAFEKIDGEWDIKITGLGLDLRVSQVKNTDLKGPKVAKNIPTVAERTQGDVVNFAAAATKKMGADGLNVLLEGREATVDYVPTPYRYTLTMSDTIVLGQRRAAQRLAAAAQALVAALGNTPDGNAVKDAVTSSLATMVGEMA